MMVVLQYYLPSDITNIVHDYMPISEFDVRHKKRMALACLCNPYYDRHEHDVSCPGCHESNRALVRHTYTMSRGVFGEHSVTNYLCINCINIKRCER